MKPKRFSTGLWVLGTVPDRYLGTGYQPDLELPAKLERIARTPHVTGVEMPYGPVLTMGNLQQVNQMVLDHTLTISSLTVNVTGDRKWALGSITNPDPSVRRDAVGMIKEAMQASRELGVGTLNLWMGQEGFDYPFEVDYTRVWNLMVEAFSECVESCPETRLSLEYKRMEPRMRSLPNSAAQALLMAQSVGAPNVGVTIDFGHAVMGGENPSQSVAMLHAHGRLFHIHIDDNYADWDWDMAAGVNHWWQLVEFCYWLERIDYDGWFVVDIFPYRHDPVELNALSVNAVLKASAAADKLDGARVEAGFAAHSAIDAYKQLLEQMG